MTEGAGETTAARLRNGRLPPGFDRWRVALAPGSERPTDAGEWAGALVLIERGTLEVECRAGGCRTFVAGDLLALGWLPLRTLRNPGREPVVVVAVRRRGAVRGAECLEVLRSRMMARRAARYDAGR